MWRCLLKRTANTCFEADRQKGMRTHQEIDRRSLAVALAVAEQIDRDPQRNGLRVARENCARWLQNSETPAVLEWKRLLDGDWEHVRKTLLADSELGRRLRQSETHGIVKTIRMRA